MGTRSSKIFLAPGSMGSSLKKDQSKIRYFNWYCVLLMVEKSIRGGISHVIHRYVKASNKYMKDYDKNKGSSHLEYWDTKNLYGQAVLFLNDFEWVKETSQFNEGFIESHNEESDEGYFLEVDVQYPEIYMSFITIYHFYQNEWKFKKLKGL